MAICLKTINKQNGATTNRWLSHLSLYVKLVSYYALAVLTVQPDGIPLTPDTSHSAAEFLTNVPVLETPLTQLFVCDVLGVVVNIALM